MATLPILGYWDDRALAEPIRLLLAYAGVTYEDKRYAVGPPPLYDKSEWTNDKKLGLGLTLPNLPYWLEPQGVRLTQTHAILMHLAAVHGLAGSTAAERAEAHMLLEGLRDWFYAFFDVTYCNAPGSDDVEPDVHVAGESQALPTSHRFMLRRATYLSQALPLQLAQWAATLGGGSSGPPRQWVAGTPSPSVADFVLGELLAQHVIFEPTCLDAAKLAPLRAFLQRFDALPAIAQYRQGSSFRPEPLHNRYSHFHRGWLDGSARKLVEDASAKAGHTLGDPAEDSAIKLDVATVRAAYRPGARAHTVRDWLVLLCVIVFLALLVLLGHAAIPAGPAQHVGESETR